MKIQRTKLNKPGNTIGTKFSVFQNYPSPRPLLRCGFLTIGPFVGIPVFHRKAFPSDNTAGVLSRTFIVKKISNSLDIHNCLFMRLHLSIGGYGLSQGLYDFVKVSISALLKSFLLIMCIDAQESTKNSRSSGFNVDAGRHLFSEGEKNLALSCSFNLNTFFGQLPRCFAGTLLLPLCLLRPILKFWSVGATLMRFHLGQM